MDASSEAVAEVARKADEITPQLDLETVFCAQYARISRVIARVVRDHSRSEELAVEVFLKLSRHRQIQGATVEGWLYRTAVRAGLDELRRRAPRSRYERLFDVGSHVASPEEIHAAKQEQSQVRLVLAYLPRRQAELLLLRSLGLSYAEVASALDLNPVSVGALLSRAQQAFRKEYVKRYGEQ